MALHQPSLVEFGTSVSRVSECLLSGAPLDQCARVIRQHFEAAVCAIQITTTGNRQEAMKVVDVDLEASTQHLGRDDIAAFDEAFPTRYASSSGDIDNVRCTLSIFRPRGGAAFTPHDQALCEIYAAQLRRGLELSARLHDSEIERSIYCQVMDSLSVGIILLDAHGRVVKTSPGGELALARRDGLAVHGGRLRALNSREDALLQAAIRAAIDAGRSSTSKGLTLPRSGRDRGLGVVIQAIDRGRRAYGSSAAVAVYLRDPETHAEVEGELVRQLFDLTPAEAAVARRLASGLSLEDAAMALDISRNTARAHLRSIFSKSGISRQTELVRMMLTSAAMLGRTGAAASHCA